MVQAATSLGRSGFQDWLIQRITALFLLIYTVYLTSYLYQNGLHYASLHQLFSSQWMRIATLLVLLSLLSHAWIGVWTVLTDYIHIAMIRLFLETLMFIAFFYCFIWGIRILWSV